VAPVPTLTAFIREARRVGEGPRARRRDKLTLIRREALRPYRPVPQTPERESHAFTADNSSDAFGESRGPAGWTRPRSASAGGKALAGRARDGESRLVAERPVFLHAWRFETTSARRSTHDNPRRIIREQIDGDLLPAVASATEMSRRPAYRIPRARREGR